MQLYTLKGNGFAVHRTGSGKAIIELVVSVPVELNRDHLALMELAGEIGCNLINAHTYTCMHAHTHIPSPLFTYAGATARLTSSGAVTSLSWKKERVKAVVDLMLGEGMIWLDRQDESGDDVYYFPSLFFKDER
jgi:hypothetical protein